MGFTPGAGYGNMLSYDVSTIRGDGFEVKNLAGTIMRAAISNLVFSRVMNQSRNAFGKGKGGTFTTPIFKNFGQPGTVSPLTSGTAIGIGTQKTDSVSMSIYEYGTGVGYEGQYGDFITDINVRSELIETLGIHIGRMVNWLDYDILVNTPFSIEVPAAGSYSTLLGTNRPLNAANYGELGPGGVALASDSLKASLVSPFNERGLYYWIANSATLRNLKSGSVFTNQQLYSNQQGLLYQVLGEFQNFIFIETEEQLSKGTSIVGGANAAGYGFGMLPSTWYYPDFGSDAGRLSVWKTIFYRGQGAIWQSKGTANLVVRSKSGAFNYGSLG